jgi:hypothetical protein
MNAPRPLRDVFGEQADRLAEDRHAALQEAGHPDLPDALVAEAVVSYSDTAPPQVAEHLAPFVSAHSAVRHGESPGPEADLSHGLHLLATAPQDASTEADPAARDVDVDRLDGTDLDATEGGLDEGWSAEAAEDVAGDAAGDAAGDEGPAPDFGGGAAPDHAGSLAEALPTDLSLDLPVLDELDHEQLPVVGDTPFDQPTDGAGASDDTAAGDAGADLDGI